VDVRGRSQWPINDLHGEFLFAIDTVPVEIDHVILAAVSRPFFEHGRIDRDLATAIPLVSMDGFPRDTVHKAYEFLFFGGVQFR
jgi:hypothetical protein